MRLIVLLALALVLALVLPAWAADLPNPRLTPGAWNVPATPLPTLCAPGYTKAARNVSLNLKGRVLLRYGLHPTPAQRAGIEIDHLVPLELDGANTIENLWPQSYASAHGARRKDVLETALKRQVCAGRLGLHEAQTMIATDWIGAYRAVVAGGRN